MEKLSSCSATGSFARRSFMRGAAAAGLCAAGALEQDLGVPVVQPTAARVWEIQRRLHVRQLVKGYGVLLATLPA
jgi:maleate cis-trans isomerase